MLVTAVDVVVVTLIVSILVAIAMRLRLDRRVVHLCRSLVAAALALESTVASLIASEDRPARRRDRDSSKRKPRTRKQRYAELEPDDGYPVVVIDDVEEEEEDPLTHFRSPPSVIMNEEDDIDFDLDDRAGRPPAQGMD